MSFGKMVVVGGAGEGWEFHWPKFAQVPGNRDSQTNFAPC